MYGMGQLQGYGYALFVGSLAGLFAAAVGHLLIFAFYLLLERDFVRRIYPAHMTYEVGLEPVSLERDPAEIGVAAGGRLRQRT